MGKGDIKSKRGKIANGSFGKKRKQRLAKSMTSSVAKPKPVKAKKVADAMEPEEKKTKKTTKRTTKKTKEAPSEE